MSIVTVYARGSVTESISRRRAAFYLRCFTPSPLSSSALPRILSLFSLSHLIIFLSIVFFSRSFSTTFYILRSFLLLFASSLVALLHPRGTNDGRWLQSRMLLSLTVTTSSLGADLIAFKPLIKK